jgi:hypothetical protein
MVKPPRRPPTLTAAHGRADGDSDAEILQD